MLEAYILAFPPRLPLDVYFVPEDCGCDDECSDEWVLISYTYDDVAALADIRFLPFTPGSHKVVAKGEGVCRHLATVFVVEPTEPCDFDAIYDSPCAEGDCFDECGDECHRAAYEYCARHDDPGCAQYVGVFERLQGEATTLALFWAPDSELVKLGIFSSAVVVPAALGCGSNADAADVAVLSATYDDEAGLLALELFPRHVGEFVVCLAADGRQATVVDHDTMLAKRGNGASPSGV
jgi:hypothetical protein